MSLPAVVEKL
uniref:Uncharacterized protein n=1 Tax=Arundo donax TaxID=35708 RepID=A0A0A9AR18_ARUDO